MIHNPHGKAFYCHAPTLLKTHDENLLAAGYCYPEKESVDATRVLTRKSNGDALWKSSHCIIDHLPYSVGNPVLSQESDSNGIWIIFVTLKGAYWNDAILMGACSEDDGKTWTLPTQLAHTGNDGSPSSGTHEQMLKILNFGANALSHSNIKVYNCSPVSTLTCFPKMSCENALAL